MARASATLDRPVDAQNFHDDREAVLDFTTGVFQGAGISELAIISSEREFTDQAEYLKFMEDPVVITIHTVNDPNAPPVIRVGVNGEGYWLPRGQRIKLRRKFVERLARSQPRRIETKMSPDQSREDAHDIKTRTGLDYPFEVNYDPSPLGPQWLRRVMRESR